jgi:hypothetical protein
VEMLFAHLKRILKMGQLCLHGPSGAYDEFALAAMAHKICSAWRSAGISRDKTGPH